MKNLVIIVLLIISFDTCHSQNFKYIKTKNIYEKFYQFSETSSNIIKYLPKNYVKDASVDYTNYIQNAINENNLIIFPDFPLLINDNGLKLKSNSIIYFNKNSLLKLRGSSDPKYSVIKIFNVSNVKLYNVTLVGDRYSHKGKGGEWGMGIRIQNANNIEIYNANIRDMWGDGIYITSYNPNISENIVIRHGVIDNVRRNGISIISGKNILIDSVQVSNVNGTLPASGIDVEPNSSKDILKNIQLNNIYTFNNQREGLLLDFSNLVSKVGSTEISLSVHAHKDNGSRYGLRISALRNAKISDKALIGKVTIKNCIWDNSKMNVPFRIGANTHQLPYIYLENLKTNKMDILKFNKKMKDLIKDRKQIKLNGI